MDKVSRCLFLVYQWCIAAPILLVLTIITAIVTSIGSLFNQTYWGYYPPKWWSRCWCWLLFVRVKVHNREYVDRKTSYVFVANHQGAFDIFSIYGYLGHNFRWMMRKGLTNIPFIGTACKLAGHILVDHSSSQALKETMEHAERQLQDGKSLVVFPEGRRTDTGEMGKFKHGAFRLASEFKLPIVPITIDGSYRVMPRDTFNVTPGTIHITYHRPIEPGTEGYDIKEVSEQCHSIIKDGLEAQ